MSVCVKYIIIELFGFFRGNIIDEISHLQLILSLQETYSASRHFRFYVGKAKMRL